MILPLWKKAKLQYKIMISLVPAIILLVAIVMVSYSSGKKTTIAHSKSTLSLIKSQAASNFNRILEQKLNQFQNWTAEDVYGLSIEFETLGELAKTIAEMQKSDPGFHRLLLVNKSGKVLLSSGGKTQENGLNGTEIDLPESVFSQQPTGFFYASKKLTKRLHLDVQSTAVFAFPTHATSGEINGAFLGVLNWQLFQNEIDDNLKILHTNGFADASVGLINSQTHNQLSTAGGSAQSSAFINSKQFKN